MAGKGSSFIMFRFFPFLYILLTYFCQRTSASSISGNCSTRVSYVYCFNSGLPSAWYNNNSVVMDGWKMRVFLLTKNANDVDFYCGFYCSGACNSYVFSVVAIRGGGGNHTVVWSANKDRPVKENAMVQLTREGLVLQDSDGTQVWSSNTSGSGNSIVGMNLNHSGNLVLFSNENDSIWESPTEKISFSPPSSTPPPIPPSTQPAENGSPGVTNLAPPPPGPRRGKGKKLVAVIAGSVAGVLVIDDPAHRPSMSTVVKVLEGVMEVDENINYKFAHAMPYASFVNHRVSAPPVESILSNPR
ncbi:hypothetical protein Pint_02446 [Pistacia integerrima]|uniref:Uncharacterized protein n=1 Tax=Pistacia integerrima TaxID=434235 RepID=A0ACC0ZJC2_9ROSI|nr:hypothetical protein Pint_02446 [Pistacia integerrima]